MIGGAAITRGAIAAIVVAPPLAWGAFLLATSQNLGPPSANGAIALVMMLAMSFIVTAIGIIAIAVPLTFAAKQMLPNDWSIALCTAAVGLGLAWSVIRQEGTVIDFPTLIGLHIGFAALIYSGVCLHHQTNSTNG